MSRREAPRRAVTTERILPTGLTPQQLLAWIDGLPADRYLSWREARQLDEAFGDLVAAGGAAFDALIEQLLSGCRRRTRRVAVAALLRLNDPRACDPLWAVYQRDRDIDALLALSQLHDERVFAAAAALLHDEQPHRRRAALCALRNLGDGRAVAVLVPLLRRRRGLLRSAALEALAAVLVASQGEDTRGIFALADVLNQTDVTLTNAGQQRRLRWFLIETLAQIDHPEARAVLYAAIRRPQLSVRVRARRVLPLRPAASA